MYWFPFDKAWKAEIVLWEHQVCSSRNDAFCSKLRKWNYYVCKFYCAIPFSLTRVVHIYILLANTTPRQPQQTQKPP